MKSVKVFIVLSLVIGFSGIPFGWGQTQEELDKYGKVIGQIIDPISGNPVNERFEIHFFPPNAIDYNYGALAVIKTDQQGRISGEVPAGQYSIVFIPESNNSKYCVEPDPSINKKYIFPIKVEQGKITQIRKAATLGGTLKIKLVDLDGKIVKAGPVFNEDAWVLISAENSNYFYDPRHRVHLSDESDGEKFILNGICPDVYKVVMQFRGLGFGDIIKKDISIIENRVTELEISIDMSNTTGIEGIVTDKYGSPLTKANVSLSPIKIDTVNHGVFEGYTGSDGKYRISGLPAGTYSIGAGNINEGFYFNLKETIEIKKNSITKKDITLNWPKN